MIRGRGGAWLFALAIAGFACPAWAQVDADQAAPDSETQAESTGEPSDVDLAAAPTRQEWVILMAILGEQLPAGAVLAELRVNDDGSVSTEVQGAAQADLTAALSPFFSQVQSEAPRLAGPERSAVRLRGIPPSLNEYRARKGAESPVSTPTAPKAAASVEPPAQPAQDLWPPLRIRRLFNQNEIRMAQLTLDGRDYIVREGSLFSNNAYRFIGMAVGADGQPSETCVVVERVSNATRRTLCPEE